MEAREKSLRVYDTKKTFFSKLSNTFSKILTPTKTGINNILISMKRNAVLKNYVLKTVKMIIKKKFLTKSLKKAIFYI